MNLLAVLMGAALAAAAPLLVSTDELEKLENTSIVDARSAEDFVAGHVARAINLDSDTISEKRGEVEGLLKPIDQLYRIVGDAGIDPKRHVVVYSDMASPEKRAKATRLVWALQYMGFPRISVLNGGIGKWKAEGRALDAGKVKADTVRIEGLEARPNLMVGHADVTKMLQDGMGVLVDMRPIAYFTGCKFKNYVVKEGHIKGARSLPNDDLFTGPDFVFKSADELQALYGRKGVGQDTRLITYCNSGQAATLGYFGAILLGSHNAAVYDGSMAEWSRLKDAPISTRPDLP